jgi:hypothetical protein
VQHPNLVTVYDADEVDGRHFLAMELVAGGDLAQFVRTGGPLLPGVACDVVRQACLGLHHAHEKGLVHRDVKPHNLMLAPDGTVKVLDLGLALLRYGEETHEHTGELTSSGAFMGTPDFVAPEQIANPHAVDARADLYSLGCTLYFLLTGKAPFPGGSAIDKLDGHRHREPAPVEQQCPRLPLGVAAAVRKLMAKRPEDRYASAAEAAAALEPFCCVDGADAASVSQRIQTLLTAQSRPPRRRRVWPWLAAAALLLAAGSLGGALAWRAWGGDRAPQVAQGPPENAGGRDGGPQPDEKRPPGDRKPDEKRAAGDKKPEAKGPEEKKPDLKAIETLEPTATQDGGERFTFRFSEFSEAPDRALVQALALRPNVVQPWFVHVANPRQRDEVVQVALCAGGQLVEGCSQVVRLPAGKTTLVRFNKMPPGPIEGADKGAQGLKEVKGPLELLVLGKGGIALNRFDLLLLLPSAYLDASLASLPLDAKGRLSLRADVRKRPNDVPLAGPPCRVELDLRPERFPGLKPGLRSGTYGGPLKLGPEGRLTLTAEGLDFDPALIKQGGWVYLTADGYERAFIWRAMVGAEGHPPAAPLLVTAPSLRLIAPQAVEPGPAVPVKVEADNLQAEDVVEVAVGRDAAGRFEVENDQVYRFRGDRAVRYRVAPSAPGGGLLLQAETRDHVATFDLRGVFGKRLLRLRVLRGAQRSPVNFLNAATGEAVQEVLQPLVLDGTPPEKVDLIGLPRAVKAGEELTLEASGEDPESGVADVLFFLGKPGADGQPPDGAPRAAGAPKAGAPGRWTARLPAPLSPSGPLFVSVRVINGAGLPTVKTVALEVLPADGGPPHERPTDK